MRKSIAPKTITARVILSVVYNRYDEKTKARNKRNNDKRVHNSEKQREYMREYRQKKAKKTA
jgi:hypothetical protein